MFCPKKRKNQQMSSSLRWALDKNLDIEDEDDLLAEDDDYKKDEG